MEYSENSRLLLQNSMILMAQLAPLWYNLSVYTLPIPICLLCNKNIRQETAKLCRHSSLLKTNRGDETLTNAIDWNMWGLLLIAAVLELTGDIALKWGAETNRWLGFGIGLVVYSLALIVFAVLLRRAELALIFALWAGIAAVLLTLAGWWLFGEALSVRRLAGIRW
jgi:small multidrug resistance pump